MISRETSNSVIVLTELSSIAICQAWPNHLSTRPKSIKAITQLMAKIILNLVCDKGDEAI
jgi:hypothetical protein